MPPGDLIHMQSFSLRPDWTSNLSMLTLGIRIEYFNIEYLNIWYLNVRVILFLYQLSHWKWQPSDKVDNCFSHHLDTDMNDPKMKFWTTEPNGLFVIRMGRDSNSKLLGMVAMQMRDEVTIELNR